MNKLNKEIAFNAVICALYVVLCFTLNSISFGATIEILLYYVFAQVLKNVYLLGFIYALLSGTLVGAELFYVLGVPFVYSLVTVGLSGLILYMAGVPFCKTILKRTAWK